MAGASGPRVSSCAALARCAGPAFGPCCREARSRAAPSRGRRGHRRRLGTCRRGPRRPHGSASRAPCAPRGCPASPVPSGRIERSWPAMGAFHAARRHPRHRRRRARDHGSHSSARDARGLAVRSARAVPARGRGAAPVCALGHGRFRPGICPGRMSRTLGPKQATEKSGRTKQHDRPAACRFGRRGGRAPPLPVSVTGKGP